MRNHVALLLLALVPVAGAAPAASPDVDCKDGGGTQLEMNICAGRDAERAKGRMKSLLADLGGVLAKERYAELTAMQGEWEALRDKECRWEQGFAEGGSVGPLIFASCITTQTDARIERLKMFLCEGGGLTGPCEASEKY